MKRTPRKPTKRRILDPNSAHLSVRVTADDIAFLNESATEVQSSVGYIVRRLIKDAREQKAARAQKATQA